MYSNWYMSCVYVDWLIADQSGMMNSKPARNMYRLLTEIN
jgi:hypothetical protein